MKAAIFLLIVLTTVPLFAQSFEVTMENPRLELGLKDYGGISGHLKNLTLDPIKLIFKRVQIIPSGWMTNVCFGDLCYPDFTDSIPPENPFVLEGGGETEFKLAVTSAPDIEDSVIAYVKITVVGSFEGDTVGLLMVATSKQKSFINPTTSIFGESIASIYPNPIISGDELNVSIKNPKDVDFRYSIYDGLGRIVMASGTPAQTITAGDNLFTLTSLANIGSGRYLLKINFTDGTSDSAPFTISR